MNQNSPVTQTVPHVNGYVFQTSDQKILEALIKFLKREMSPIEFTTVVNHRTGCTEVHTVGEEPTPTMHLMARSFLAGWWASNGL